MTIPTLTERVDRPVLTKKTEPVPLQKLRPISESIMTMDEDDRSSFDRLWKERKPMSLRIVRKSILDTGKSTTVLTETEYRSEAI